MLYYIKNKLNNIIISIPRIETLCLNQVKAPNRVTSLISRQTNLILYLRLSKKTVQIWSF